MYFVTFIKLAILFKNTKKERHLYHLLLHKSVNIRMSLCSRVMQMKVVVSRQTDISQLSSLCRNYFCLSNRTQKSQVRIFKFIDIAKQFPDFPPTARFIRSFAVLRSARLRDTTRGSTYLYRGLRTLTMTYENIIVTLSFKNYKIFNTYWLVSYIKIPK